MDEKIELIKIIAEKLKVTTIIISVLVSVLVAKFITDDRLWLIFSFCATYLLVEVVCWCHTAIEKRRKANKQQREADEQDEKNLREMNEMIWQHFLSLGKESLDIAVEIYKCDKIDSTNELLRLITSDNKLAAFTHFYNHNPFNIALGNRQYLPCIRFQSKDGNALIAFDQYFYKLLEHYVTTGRKERM